MDKLSGLPKKESSSEQPLKGVYHVVIDIKVRSSQNITLKDLRKKISELGDIDGFYIEKFEKEGPTLSIGETVILNTDLSIERSVYLDTSGNLIITDSSVSPSIECVGSYPIFLAKGTVAEVNKIVGDEVEILFTGSTVNVEGLQKEAYLGILRLSDSIISRFD